MDEAASLLSQAQAVSDSRIVNYLLGWTKFYQGQRQPAEALLETMIGTDGPLPGNARATLAALLASRGATADARLLARRVAAEPDLIHHGAYGLGTAYAQLRDPPSALRCCRRRRRRAFPAIRGTRGIRCSIPSAAIPASPTSCASCGGRGRPCGRNTRPRRDGPAPAELDPTRRCRLND
jgi:hypothetical protein